MNCLIGKQPGPRPGAAGSWCGAPDRSMYAGCAQCAVTDVRLDDRRRTLTCNQVSQPEARPGVASHGTGTVPLRQGLAQPQLL